MPERTEAHAPRPETTQQAGDMHESPPGTALAHLTCPHAEPPRCGSETLHAAVLGASDGLTSNLSLMMGIAGVTVDTRALVLTGVAGLLGGAFSMAVAEWTSVTSVREAAERDNRVKAAALAAARQRVRRTVRLMYLSSEVREDEAMPGDEEEVTFLPPLGAALDPVRRSPSYAALTALVFFALGAAVPLLPYLVASGLVAIVASLVLSAIALFGVGAAVTIFTGRSAFVGGGRQLALGLLAAGFTFTLGRTIGGVVG